MNKVTTSPSKKFVSFLRSGIRKIVYRPTVVDFVFSAGAACRTATMLRRVNMRTFSSPLDWMFRYDLSLYSDLLHKENLICSGSMRRMRNRLPNTETSETFERE